MKHGETVKKKKKLIEKVFVSDLKDVGDYFQHDDQIIILRHYIKKKIFRFY